MLFTYNIILNTVPEAGSSHQAAPLSPVYTTVTTSTTYLRYSIKNNIICRILDIESIKNIVQFDLENVQCKKTRKKNISGQ